MPPAAKRTSTDANTEPKDPKPKRQQRAKPPVQKNSRTPKSTRAKPPAKPAVPEALIPPSLTPYGPQKRSPLNFSIPNPSFVTVYVGNSPNTQMFILHKSAIMHHSPMFAKMLSSPCLMNPTTENRPITVNQTPRPSQNPKVVTNGLGSKSSSSLNMAGNTPTVPSTVQIVTQTIHLPTISPSVFGLFTNWLYFQELPRPTSEDQVPDLLELTELWLFGSKYQIPGLQNTTVLPLVYLLSRHDLIFGDLDKSRSFGRSKLKKFCDMAYLDSIEAGKEDVQGADWKKPLKQLAVDTVLRYIAKGVPVANWVPDFPKGMVVDFTSEMVRCVEGLPKDTRGAIGSREKSYLVDVNEDSGNMVRPPKVGQKRQGQIGRIPTSGGDRANNNEGEQIETRDLYNRGLNNKTESREGELNVMEQGCQNRLQVGVPEMRDNNQNAGVMQRVGKEDIVSTKT